jgi:hypothetical protein
MPVKVAHPLMLRAIAAAKKKDGRIDAGKLPVTGVYLVRGYKVRERMHDEPFDGALQVTRPVSHVGPLFKQKTLADFGDR